MTQVPSAVIHLIEPTTLPNTVSKDYSQRNIVLYRCSVYYIHLGNKFLELKHFMFLPYKQKISLKIHLHILKHVVI